MPRALRISFFTRSPSTLHAVLRRGQVNDNRRIASAFSVSSTTASLPAGRECRIQPAHPGRRRHQELFRLRKYPESRRSLPFLISPARITALDRRSIRRRWRIQNHFFHIRARRIPSRRIISCFSTLPDNLLLQRYSFAPGDLLFLLPRGFDRQRTVSAEKLLFGSEVLVHHKYRRLQHLLVCCGCLQRPS